jgi:hypothetical protein
METASADNTQHDRAEERGQRHALEMAVQAAAAMAAATAVRAFQGGARGFLAEAEAGRSPPDLVQLRLRANGHSLCLCR